MIESLNALVECDFCFFFKQKTAYEMRISDWSSDVCSSDLWRDGGDLGPARPHRQCRDRRRRTGRDAGEPWRARLAGLPGEPEIGRASCRERVVSTCRSRWSPYH